MTLSAEWLAQIERARAVFAVRPDPTVFDGWNPEEQWRAPEGTEEGGQWVEMPDVKADTDVDAVADSGEKAHARKAEREGKKPPKPSEPVKATTTGHPLPPGPPPKTRTPVKNFKPAGRAQWNVVPKGYRKGTHAELRAVTNSPLYSGIHVSKDPNSHNPYVLFKTAGGDPQRLYTFTHHVTQERKKWARVERFIRNRHLLNADLEEGMRVGNDSAAALRMMLDTGMRPSSETAASTKRDEKGKPILDANGNEQKEQTYGATTLEGRHVVDNGGDTVTLDFIGKAGVRNEIKVKNPALVADIRRRAGNAGDNGQLYPEATPKSMNEMLAAKTGGGFTNKDLRTVEANAYVREAFDRIMAKHGHAPRNQAEFAEWIEEASLVASQRLGNKHDTFKKSYMSMLTFIDLFPEGTLEDYWEWGKKMLDRRSLTSSAFLPETGPVDKLTPEELMEVYAEMSRSMPPLSVLIEKHLSNKGLADLGPDDEPPLDEDDDDGLEGDGESPLIDLLSERPRVPKRPPLA